MQNTLPESMSIKSRNKRLYETLKGMGLNVTPVPRKDYPDVIDYIVVSAVAPGVPLDYCRGSTTSGPGVKDYFSQD